MIVKNRWKKVLLGVTLFLFIMVVAIGVNYSLKREPRVGEQAVSDVVFD